MSSTRRRFLAGAGLALVGSGAGAAAVDTDESGAGSTTDWPMARYDPAGTGHNPAATGPKDGVEIAWAHDAPEWFRGTTSPVLLDGTVYAAGDGLLALDADTDGETLWIDVGGNANTYSMLDETNRRAWQGIRIARAFQAYQHYQLVDDVIHELSQRAGLVVATNVALHYEKSDHPDAEVDRLFASALEKLAAIGDSLSIPVLVSAPYASEDRWAQIREKAVDEIEVTRTGLGYRFASEDFDTMGYWQHGWWQTTIPYWVELFGAVDVDEEVLEITADMVVA